uniref:MAM domain-containing protein n=1 Tax=Plectus sambesii TaxID=2011161 RepID=A0A914VUI7_9BILA
MGFFVTISELPYLPASESTVNTIFKLNCDFSSTCSWSSRGQTGDPWTLGTGSPDPLLWLAATGTMTVPSEPFTLIELRGAQGDRLMSDPIECQIGEGVFRFRYWVTSTVAVHVCAVDAIDGTRLCTRDLKKYPIPGQANITIRPPNINHPFQIGIFTNNGEGLAAVDDIFYNYTTCDISPALANNITELIFASSTLPTTQTTSISSTTTLPITTTSSIADAVSFVNGSNTEPLFDRRKSAFIDSTDALICDFTDSFPCRWGADSGDWASALKGALSESTLSRTRTVERPEFPSAIVLPGAAMFSSDPIRCQKGPGQLILRYWATDEVTLQVCVFGYQKTSTLTICSEFFGNKEPDYPTPKQVDFRSSINEPFTISIVPDWKESPSNNTNFLIIDEIAYLADICDTDQPLEHPTSTIRTTVKQFFEKTLQKEMFATTNAQTTSSAAIPMQNIVPLIPTFPATQTPRIFATTRRAKPSYATTRIYATTRRTKPNFATPRSRPTTAAVYFPTAAKKLETSACSLVNCRFDGSACNYLNNRVSTKKWKLKDEKYHYPLSKLTEIRPSNFNRQYITTILRPNDFAVLESPTFKITEDNFILFQYFRPVFGSTIRLCTSEDLNQQLINSGIPHVCPVVIPELSVDTAWQWNAVYVRIPKETTKFFLIAQNNGKSSAAPVALDNVRLSACR